AEGAAFAIAADPRARWRDRPRGRNAGERAVVRVARRRIAAAPAISVGRRAKAGPPLAESTLRSEATWGSHQDDRTVSDRARTTRGRRTPATPESRWHTATSSKSVRAGAYPPPVAACGQLEQCAWCESISATDLSVDEI